MKLKMMMLLGLELIEDYFTMYDDSVRFFQELAGVRTRVQFGHIEKMIRKQALVADTDRGLQLTLLGKKQIQKEFPLLGWRKKPWDGKWRIVMYDLPEKDRYKRDALRRVLKKLGMGQWQLSVWVSPHPIQDKIYGLLKRYGLENYCGVYEAKRLVGEDDREFARRIWDLDELNRSYQRGEVAMEELMDDPFLPKELLPENWYWEKAMKEMVCRSLQRRAGVNNNCMVNGIGRSLDRSRLQEIYTNRS